MATLVGALVNWLKGNRDTLEAGLDLFNKFAEGVGKALAFIPSTLALLLEKFGEFFNSAAKGVADFITEIANGLRLIPKIGAALAAPLDKAAASIRSFGTKVETTFDNAAKPLRSFATTITNATKQVISDGSFDKIVNKLETVQKVLVAVSKTASGLSEKEFGTDLVNFISGGLSKIGAASSKIGSTILEAGDIKLGTELVQMLSDASKFIGGAVSKVGEFVA